MEKVRMQVPNILTNLRPSPARLTTPGALTDREKIYTRLAYQFQGMKG